MPLTKFEDKCKLFFNNNNNNNNNSNNNSNNNIIIISFILERPIDYFPSSIIQNVKGGSLHKNDTI